MTPPAPDAAFLAAQIRWAMGRGLPAQVAEDLVFESWETARARFDPTKGTFEAYMQRIVRNRCAYWWREEARADRAAHGLRLVPPHDGPRAEQAARNQDALIAALEPDERAVFAAWALQRHLGKGRVRAEDVGRSIGLAPNEFENAKRRLKLRLEALLARFGWSVGELLHGGDDVDRTG